MSAPPIPAGAPGAIRLHARRCVRHAAREAAARCPGCGEFFCRECVVEHDGRLLCATCLARAAAGRRSGRQRLAVIRRAATTIVATLVLWLLFYGVGAFLVRIPPDVHDGTIWKKKVESMPP